jgi:hypothetical protein
MLRVGIFVEQMGDAAELLRGTLQGFDLLTKLGLFGLFPAKYIINVSHAEPPDSNVVSGLVRINRGGPGSGNFGNQRRALGLACCGRRAGGRLSLPLQAPARLWRAEKVFEVSLDFP